MSAADTNESLSVVQPVCPGRAGETMESANDRELLRPTYAVRLLGASLAAAVRATSEAQLLEAVCRLVVEQGGYRLAWVGYSTNTADKAVCVMARAGHDDGYLERVDISWGDDARGRGPTGSAIRTASIIACQDTRNDPVYEPWSREASARGFGSSVALPMVLPDGPVLGALSIYADRSGAFDDTSIQLIKDLAASLTLGVLALRDREGRERALAALHEDRTRLQTILDSSPAGICLIEASGAIAQVNSRMVEMFGYAADELLGRTVEVLVPGDMNGRHARHRHEFNANPRSRPMGTRSFYDARRRDGTTLPVDVSLNPVTLSGRPMVLAVVLDVSERVQAETELRQKEELFTKLTDTIPDRIYFKDRQSRFVRINAKAARDMGFADPRDAVGKSDFDIFVEPHAHRAFSDDQRLMDTGEPLVAVEEMETWPDGRITWSSTTKVPLRDEHGTVTGLVGISRDITRRKQLEAQFLQAQKMQVVGQLAGGVAHDFNNILCAMLAGVAMLRSAPGASAEQNIELGELEALIRRGSGLTRQLLALSRPSVVERRRVDVNDLLKDFGRMLARLVGSHIVFRIEPSPSPLLIEADAGMVEQVIMNLGVNARDAMPDGGTLLLRAYPDLRPLAGDATELPRDVVCIEVRDTGCGMDEETQKRIFEPFFTTKGEQHGTGLGLATVYAIIKQHGGWIDVASAPGKGSTFRVFLPAADRTAPSDPSA